VGDLREAALALCRRLCAQGQGPRPTRNFSVREALSDSDVAEALAKHARTIKGLTAPSLVIDALKAASLPFDQGMRVEASLADESLELQESRALRQLFFAERLAGKVPGTSGDSMAPIRTAAVIGAGTMGSGIALAFADAGLSVILIDSAEAGLERGMETIRSNYAANVKPGRIDQPTADLRKSRITPSTNLADAGKAEVVIEAVFEDMDVKKQVLCALDAILPEQRLIASNTSTLSITELAHTMVHSQRLVGLHFFSPAHIMKLLEIVKGRGTAPHILSAALQVSRLLKKIAVVANDGFGFIGNRMMLDGYFREAEQLMLEGCSPAEVDGALERFGFAMGPQRVSDLGGTDVGTKARAQLYKRERQSGSLFCDRRSPDRSRASGSEERGRILPLRTRMPRRAAGSRCDPSDRAARSGSRHRAALDSGIRNRRALRAVADTDGRQSARGGDRGPRVGRRCGLDQRLRLSTLSRRAAFLRGHPGNRSCRGPHPALSRALRPLLEAVIPDRPVGGRGPQLRAVGSIAKLMHTR
jgi:3-hydroxyacyl-CoA dehydrogenase